MTSGVDTATRHAEIHALFEAEQRNPPVLNGRADVPGSPDVLTHDWLTEVLCEGHNAAQVESFDHGSQYNGTTSGRRLRIHYNDAGRAAGLPERLFGGRWPPMSACPTFSALRRPSKISIALRRWTNGSQLMKQRYLSRSNPSFSRA